MEFVNGEWQETGEWKFDSRGALKALEMEGKHQAMFTEKREIEAKVENSGTIKVEQVDINDRLKQFEDKN